MGNINKPSDGKERQPPKAAAGGFAGVVPGAPPPGMPTSESTDVESSPPAPAPVVTKVAKGGHKRGLPSLDLRNVKMAAAAASEACPTAREGGGATARLPTMTSDGILITEQHRKEAKLMELMKVCSTVTPWLFIAGEKISVDLGTLREKSITCVVNCADGTCASPFVDAGILYHALPLRDSPDEELVPFLYGVVETVEAVRRAGGRTLVHCHQGVSRSGSFVIAYLMWAYGLGWQATLDVARDVRGTISPNPGFLCQLMEWEVELAAMRSRQLSSACLPPDDLKAPATAALLEVVPAVRQPWLSPALPAVARTVPDGAAAAIPLPFTVQVVRLADRRPAQPTPATMSSSGVYVLRVPVSLPSWSRAPDLAAARGAVSAGERVFVWVGSGAVEPAAAIQAAVDEIRRWLLLVPAPAPADPSAPLNLSAPYVPPAVSVEDPMVLRQGVNDGPLLAVLGMPPWPSTAPAAAPTAFAEAIAKAAAAASPEDTPPLHRRDGDDGDAEDDPGTTSSRPSLHRYTGATIPWEALAVYEDEDLEDDGLYALLPAEAVGGAAFVWQGSCCEVENGLELVTAMVAARSVAVTLPTAVEVQGSESQAFWDAFEAGY